MAYWAFGMATGPAWNAWITSLVPAELRPRFFARRTRFTQGTLFGAIAVGGLLLQWGQRAEAVPAIFALLFATATGARLVSARFLARQSEPAGLARTHETVPLWGVLAAARHGGSGRVLAYLVGMQAAVHVAAPFFTPYMLGPLALSYAEFMVLTASAFLARVCVLPLLGRVAEARGTRLVLLWGAAGIVPLPLLWLVSHHFLYLLVLQLLAGSAWAALEFATLLFFFEGIAESRRASVLAAYNLASAAAIALGALLGSQLFTVLDPSPAVYGWLFAVSSAGRLVMLGVLRGMPPLRRRIVMRLRTLAVRPSAGAIQRPILGSVDEEPPPS